jgi:hypothetical protein
LNRWSGGGIFVLSAKVSKFSITFLLCVFFYSATFSVSRVLRDRRQFKQNLS